MTAKKPNPEGWLAEFYPEPAEVAAARGVVAAAEHSLRKWTGVTKRNLARYGQRLVGSVIEQADAEAKEVMLLGNDTCALCIAHPSPHDGTDCASCPLGRATGMGCGVYGSPYRVAVGSGNISRLLAALRKALKLAREDEAHERAAGVGA